jgi:hypothetical protein
MTDGARKHLLGAPAGAGDSDHESRWQGFDPGRPLDPIIADIRRSLGADQMAGDDSLQGRWLPVSALGRADADSGGGVDVGSAGIALAVAGVVLWPGMARRTWDWVMGFYGWYRWTVNATCLASAGVLMFLLG